MRRVEPSDVYGGPPLANPNPRRPDRDGKRTRKLLAYLMHRDGGLCRRCGRAIDPAISAMHPDGGTVGHVIPYRDGGTMAVHNLAAEHRRCNLDAKATNDPRARVVTP